VVGLLGSEPTTEVMLGSAALHVAAHGRCPVAVIRYDRTGAVPGSGRCRRGGAQRLRPVMFAFDEAAVPGSGW
jgi:hypothetical protein